jgi:hypothetical protein
MPVPPASGPNEPRALSAREQAILASIEEDLSTTDPALAKALAQRMASGLFDFAPTALRQGAVLTLALLVLLGAAGLIPGWGWSILAVLAALLVVPWVLLQAFERFDRE